MLRSLRLRLAGIGRLPRLLAATLCLVLAGLSALSGRAESPRAAGGVPVVVAARALPVGHVLVRADLAVARWPAGTPPDNARAAPDPLVGARLGSPLHAREAVTSTRLLSGDLAAGLGPDQVATPVEFDDPHLTELVRPGNRVDLVATPRPPDVPEEAAARSSPAATLVAAGAPVLAVMPASDSGGSELVLAVTRVTAVRITRDRPTQLFTVFVVAP